MNKLRYDTLHAGWLLASLVPAHTAKCRRLLDTLPPKNKIAAEAYARKCIADSLAIASGRVLTGYENNPYAP